MVFELIFLLQLTPIRKKLGPIPRNSSAPHFIDANKILPRNVSTPGFAIGGKNPNLRPTYGSQLSADSNQQQVMFERWYPYMQT